MRWVYCGSERRKRSSEENQTRRLGTKELKNVRKGDHLELPGRKRIIERSRPKPAS